MANGRTTSSEVTQASMSALGGSRNSTSNDLSAPRAELWTRLAAASRKAQFAVSEVLPSGTRFDFARPFLPAALTGADSVSWLSSQDRLTLGHVRAHAYLAIFGLVEEFILPFVVGHARADERDRARSAALLGFAAEEAKHIQLFEAFRTTFAAGADRDLAVIGPARDVRTAVLSRPDLAVALLVLHIEWVTQRHWLECVRGDASLEPAFVGLLRAHWMEEAQHARLDDLLVRDLAEGASAHRIAEGVDGYLDLCAMFDEAFAGQARLDVDGFAALRGRSLSSNENDELVRSQTAVLRRSFLGAGMTHPAFQRTFAAIAPGARRKLDSAAARFA